MKKNKFFRLLVESFWSGIIVLLPITILIIGFGWLYTTITGYLKPVTESFVIHWGIKLTKIQLHIILANILTICLILFGILLIGMFIRTRIGKKIHSYIIQLFNKIPGYNIIQTTINQFIGEGRKSPFSKVALVQLYENSTLITAFVTDTYKIKTKTGWKPARITVFVPSVPNPTRGFIYHVKPEYVHILDIPVDEAIRSFIGFGAGSEKLLEKYSHTTKDTEK